jgi:hypothetical protein
MRQDLGKALLDIEAMRAQLARSSEFRGYGPTTLAATGAAAVVAALLQARWLPAPLDDISFYLALWVATAALSAVLIGAEMVARSRRIHSGLSDEMLRSAFEQFLPSVVAGLLLACVLLRSAPREVWLLPGLWQIVLSLGMFASSRLVPRPMLAVPIWYLASGLACIAFANGDNALSPLAMGLPFGVGQILAAALLHLFGGRDEQA